MKWIYYVFCLGVCLSSLMSYATAQIITVEGGRVTDGGIIIIERNPFYTITSKATLKEIIVNITFHKEAMFRLEEGAYTNSDGTNTVLIYRNPFYDTTSRYYGCTSNITLRILTPVNGSNFFGTAGNTQNTTFELTGAVSPTCWYWTSGSWNLWSGCGNGGNETNNKMITYPEGYPVTLTVYVLDGCGSSATAQTQFSVVFFHALGRGRMFFVLVFMMVFLLFWRWRRRRGVKFYDFDEPV